MRTNVIGIFIGLAMIGISPIGAAESIQDKECGSKVLPALIKDAAKLAKADPKYVVMVDDPRAFCSCLGIKDTEKVARVINNKRAFVLNNSFPIYLNMDGEAKELSDEYKKTGDKYLKVFFASYLVHENYHVESGSDVESEALKRELAFLLKNGINPSDPNVTLLQKRVEEAQAQEKNGVSQTVLVGMTR